ncbi:MAG: hypothetical protein ACXWMP_14295 [Gemmatimonadaceae bacterium]
MPSRFTTPSLGALGGGGGDIYLGAGTWQVGLAYRGLTSNQVIVGHQVRNDLGAGGQPSIVHSHLLNFSLVYGVTDRLSLTLNTPVSRGSQTGVHADGLWHENTSAGLGEISVSANYWLRNAQALQPGGNVAIGFGVKAPTGKNNVEGTVWKADGTSVPFPVVPAIELGDGGWGFTLSTKAFHPVRERSYVYGGGSYTLNPKKTTDVVRSPGSTVPWSVPDTWDANAGVSTLVSPALGLSLNLGLLAYGTPRRDLIGGRDNGNRLPATVGYVSPGIGIVRGANAFTLSVPVRAYMNFLPSYVDAAAGRSGGGGLARHLILASYAVRF